MDSKTFQISNEQYEKMKEFYLDSLSFPNNPYLLCEAKLDEVKVSFYRNAKEEKKVVFLGNKANQEASIWFNSSTSPSDLENSVQENNTYLSLQTQIGSDEVGMGDFFGPIVVAASYLRQDQMDLLLQEGIKDSKKLNDDKIIAIVKKLLTQVDYEYFVLENPRLNEATAKGYNLNSIKAHLHNLCLLKLQKKHPECQETYLDQFCEKSTFYRYLNVKELAKNVTFHIKGETYYPSVAVASMIARYFFIQEMDKLSVKYHMDIAYGMNDKVKQCALAFLNKYGKVEFDKVVKKTFKTYQEILNEGENKNELC